LKVGFTDAAPCKATPLPSYCVKTWRGVSKLSLENGGDVSPVAEGLAWQLHQMATGPNFYPAGYDPALAAWVTLRVNGSNLGVYANVEQRNKQFMRNRGLWNSTSTWHYEQDDIGYPVLEDSPPALLDGTVPDSPQYFGLCYAPFLPASAECPTPSDLALAGELNAHIHMRAMLTQGAVDALTSNNDALMSKGKNFNFVDRVDPATSSVLQRRYFPWDLDAVLGKNGSTGSTNIYALSITRNKRGAITGSVQSPYQQVILNHFDFRKQYNETILGLLNGPLGSARVAEFLNQVEATLTPALENDPYVAAVLGGDSIPAHFQSLRDWWQVREADVRQQVAANEPKPRADYLGRPKVTGLTVTPAVAGASAPVSIQATAEAALGIAEARVNLHDSEWQLLDALDGAYGGIAEGVAGTVTSPALSGTYSLCVRATDAALNESPPVCTNLTVDARAPVDLIAAIPATVRTGATLTLAVTLKSAGVPVANRSVQFVFNRTTYGATTGATGHAAVTLKAPTKIGSYAASVSFAGDTSFVGASYASTVQVVK
jgi:hypothetical protein